MKFRNFEKIVAIFVALSFGLTNTVGYSGYFSDLHSDSSSASTVRALALQDSRIRNELKWLLGLPVESYTASRQPLDMEVIDSLTRRSELRSKTNVFDTSRGTGRSTLRKIDIDSLTNGLRVGNDASLAQLISIVENDGELAHQILQKLESIQPKNKPHRIGVTGAVGVGKSSLVEDMIVEYRKHGKRVGAIAIDPTSPITGGAILADRMRLSQEILTDLNVFYRSMATRGGVGGIAKTTANVAKLFDYYASDSGKQFDVLLIETEGVGQSQKEIREITDTVVAAIPPDAGDILTLSKDSYLTVADVLVVNKADRKGAKETANIARRVFQKDGKTNWNPPVIETIAIQGSGVGVPEVVDAISAHWKTLQSQKQLEKLASITPQSKGRIIVVGHSRPALRAAKKFSEAGVESILLPWETSEALHSKIQEDVDAVYVADDQSFEDDTYLDIDRNRLLIFNQKTPFEKIVEQVSQHAIEKVQSNTSEKIIQRYDYDEQLGKIAKASRLISIVENSHSPVRTSVLSESGLLPRNTPRIGFMGPPGVGKSSVVSKTVKELRKAGLKVGVIAIDPSSDKSGGALLIDRYRMEEVTRRNDDGGVFIRSVGLRGGKGGIPEHLDEMARVMETAGMDIILIETEGSGQSQDDIKNVVDETILVLSPSYLGDIQTMKAGSMEVADITVLNQADRERAFVAFRELGAGLSTQPAREDNWTPLAIQTIAIKDKGISRLTFEMLRYLEQTKTGRNLRSQIPNLMAKLGLSVGDNIEDQLLKPKKPLVNLSKLPKTEEPGKFPFTRGIFPAPKPGQIYTARQYAGFNTARDTNRRFHEIMQAGHKAFSLAFQNASQIGIDSDDPRAIYNIGTEGAPVDSIRDMATIFDGIDTLDSEVSTSMTINAAAAPILAMYLGVAVRRLMKEKGMTENDAIEFARKSLRGTVQNDNNKERTTRNNFGISGSGSLYLTNDMFEYFAGTRFNTISISGYHMREAGASPVQEIAFTLMNAILYAQNFLKNQRVDSKVTVDDVLKQFSFFFDSLLFDETKETLLDEIAKFRAARRLWALIANEMLHATEEKAMHLRFHSQTSGVPLRSDETGEEEMVNVGRIAMEGLAAILGGTQTLHLDAYDEPTNLPTQKSSSVALRSHAMLKQMIETQEYDSLGGSEILEKKTDDMTKRAMELIQLLVALNQKEGQEAVEQFMRDAIQDEAMKRGMLRAERLSKEMPESESKLVESSSSNLMEQFQKRSDEIASLEGKMASYETVRKEVLGNLKKLKEERDNSKVQAALSEITRVAKAGENTMPHFIKAALAEATVGEMMDAARVVFGDHKKSIFPSKTSRQKPIRQIKSERPVRILTAKPGLDGHDRGLNLVSAAFKNAGLEVIYGGLRQTPQSIAQAAVEENVDFIGISSLSGARLHFISDLMKELKKYSAQDRIKVIVGGITEDDGPYLMQLGVDFISDPSHGTGELHQALDYIQEWANENVNEVEVRSELRKIATHPVDLKKEAIDFVTRKEGWLLENGNRVSARENRLSIVFSETRSNASAYKFGHSGVDAIGVLNHSLSEMNMDEGAGEIYQWGHDGPPLSRVSKETERLIKEKIKELKVKEAKWKEETGFDKIEKFLQSIFGPRSAYQSITVYIRYGTKPRALTKIFDRQKDEVLIEDIFITIPRDIENPVEFLKALSNSRKIDSSERKKIEAKIKELESGKSNLPRRRSELRIDFKRMSDAEIRLKIFQDINGLVLIPTLHVFLTQGVFKLFGMKDNPKEVTLREIAALSSDPEKNMGNIYGAMRTLALQGWVKTKGVDSDTSYQLTSEGRIVFDIVKEIKSTIELVNNTLHEMTEYYALFRRPPPTGIDMALTHYQTLIQASQRGWSLPKYSDENYQKIADLIKKYLDGVLMSPTLVALGMPDYQAQSGSIIKVGPPIFDLFESGKLSFDKLPSNYNQAMLKAAFDLLESQGFVSREENVVTLNENGESLVKRVGSYGVTASYLPSYAVLSEYLFGNPDPLGVDQDHHIDRVMDVWGSGFAHSPYLKAIFKEIDRVFNQPLDGQPAGIADMGAGDAHLLAEMVDYIIQNTSRGKNLETHPLVVVAADYNEKARQRAQATLKKFEKIKGVITEVVFGDVTNPEEYDRLIQKVMSENHNLWVQKPDGDKEPLGAKHLFHTQMFLPHERELKIRDEDEAHKILKQELVSLRTDEKRLKSFLNILKVDSLPENDAGAIELLLSRFSVSYSYKGRLVSRIIAIADFLRFMKEWEKFAKYGLLLLELHTPDLSEMDEARNYGIAANQVPAAAYWATHWISQLIMPFESYRTLLGLLGLEPSDTNRYPNPATKNPTVISLLTLRSNGDAANDVVLWNEVKERPKTNGNGRKIKKILVAARGEEAIQIIRAAKALGIQTVAIHPRNHDGSYAKEADQIVEIEPGAKHDSLKNTDALVRAAEQLGVDAIHPGFSILSEDDQFLKLAKQKNVLVIAPSPDALQAMHIMRPNLEVEESLKGRVLRYGIPVLPGSDFVETDPVSAKAKAETLGFPVIVKSAIGGDERLIARVGSSAEFRAIFNRLSREANYSFRDDGIYIEKAANFSRHVRVQFVMDSTGQFVTFPASVSAIQRNHQNLVEETAARDHLQSLGDESRGYVQKILAGLRADGLIYQGVGEIEFLQDVEGHLYFLDLNHRISSEVWNESDGKVDFIKTQLQLAQGKSLTELGISERSNVKTQTIVFNIYAEDPRNGFAVSREAQIKKIRTAQVEGVHYAHLVPDDFVIPSEKSPLIAKVIVTGSSRKEVIERSKQALDQLKIEAASDKTKLHTTLLLYRQLVRMQDFQDGVMDDSYFTGLTRKIPEKSEKEKPKADKPMRARERLKALLDSGAPFEELNADLESVDFLNFGSRDGTYAEQLERTKKELKEKDAIMTGVGLINEKKVAIGVVDFKFVGGTFGSVVGEKIARLAEYANRENLPLILVTASGGARILEGVTSMMQLVKTTVTIKKYREDGGFYVSILTDPTLAGPAVSYALQGDLIIAEPYSRIGFAGRKVTEKFLQIRSGEDVLPEGFQEAEGWLRNGLIDDIIPRAYMRNRLIQVVDQFYSTTRQSPNPNWKPFAPILNPAPQITNGYGLRVGKRVAMDVVDLSRKQTRTERRPRGREYIAGLGGRFEEWDNSKDVAMVGGVVHLSGGRKMVVAATQKGLEDTVRKEDFPNDFQNRRYIWERGRRAKGMPDQNGYLFLMRLLDYARENNYPVVTFIDLPGGFSGPDAEAGGIAKWISHSIEKSVLHPAPIISVIVGEGGSGGAMALATGNVVLIHENAYYSVIAPESASKILFGDLLKKAEMAEALALIPERLKELGIIDEIIPEPIGGAHVNHDETIARTIDRVFAHLDALSKLSPEQIRAQRYWRYRNLGFYIENGSIFKSTHEPIAHESTLIHPRSELREAIQADDLKDGLQKLDELVRDRLTKKEAPLIIRIVGLPGAGKTFTSQISEQSGLNGFPSDQIAVIESDQYEPKIAQNESGNGEVIIDEQGYLVGLPKDMDWKKYSYINRFAYDLLKALEEKKVVIIEGFLGDYLLSRLHEPESVPILHAVVHGRPDFDIRPQLRGKSFEPDIQVLITAPSEVRKERIQKRDGTLALFHQGENLFDNHIKPFNPNFGRDLVIQNGDAVDQTALVRQRVEEKRVEASTRSELRREVLLRPTPDIDTLTVLNQLQQVLEGVDARVFVDKQIRERTLQAFTGDRTLPKDSKIGIVLSGSFLSRGLYGILPAFLKKFGTNMEFAFIAQTDIDEGLVTVINTVLAPYGKKVLFASDVAAAAKRLTDEHSVQSVRFITIASSSEDLEFLRNGVGEARNIPKDVKTIALTEDAIQELLSTSELTAIFQVASKIQKLLYQMA